MERHADDLDEGRLVAMYRFEEPWTSWEVHPAGDEVVCCIQGQMTLHQELPNGDKQVASSSGPATMRSIRRASGIPPTPTARWSRCSSRPEKVKIGHAELVSPPTRPSRYCC